MPDPYGLPSGGQRLVVAERAGRVSGREIVIPGLRAHPDIAPAPNGFNQEFDSVQLGGATMGSPTTLDSNKTLASHLYLSGPSAASHANIGRYWVAPATPFTVTAKLASWTGRQANTSIAQFCGLFVGVATPGAFLTAEIQTPGGGTAETRFAMYQWTNPTTFNTSRGTSTSTPAFGVTPPFYLRLVVTSSSSIAGYFSRDGLLWTAIAAGVNPGITIATFGVFCNPGTNSADLQAAFDWIRVTTP
jgi:hypothetical protein